eukprot:9319584-Karenia_brevis.AAC.1
MGTLVQPAGGNAWLEGKVGQMVPPNERVLAVYVKSREPKAPTPDIDRVKIFVLSTRKSHLDQNKHLAQQFSDSTINADELRFWKSNYGGKVCKGK